VAQHVSGIVPPIIRSVQLHPQSLVLHALQVEGCSVVGHSRAGYPAALLKELLNKQILLSVIKYTVMLYHLSVTVASIYTNVDIQE